MGTWAALRTVEACGRGTGQYSKCLAVSGSHLIIGTITCGDQQGVVRVWSLETLELLHTLPQPNGSGVRALLAMRGDVWACVGRDVVLWGRLSA